jgi:hypothetical protein
VAAAAALMPAVTKAAAAVEQAQCLLDHNHSLSEILTQLQLVPVVLAAYLAMVLKALILYSHQ